MDLEIVATVVGVEALVLDEPKELNDEVMPVPPVMNVEATLEKVVVGKPVCWGSTCIGLCDCGWG